MRLPLRAWKEVFERFLLNDHSRARKKAQYRPALETLEVRTMFWATQESQNDSPDCEPCCTCSPVGASSSGGANTSAPGSSASNAAGAGGGAAGAAAGAAGSAGGASSDSVAAGGDEGAPSPHYNSINTPHPILRFDSVGEEAFGEPPVGTAYMEAEVNFGPLASYDVYYEVPETSTDYALEFQVNADTLPTGRYHWTVYFSYYDSEDNELGDAVWVDGYQNVINRKTSDVGTADERTNPFGEGWTLPELDRLYVQTGSEDENLNGALLVTGDNKAVWFQSSEGSYTTSPNPYLGPGATLAQNDDDSFTLTYPDGTLSNFDENGLLTSRVDRHGNAVRTYAYGGDGLADDDLSTITDTVGRVTHLDYTEGMVTSITDFWDGDGPTEGVSQTTTYDYDSGHLIRVTQSDPDGDGGPQASPVTTYGYDGETGLMTSVTDARGLETDIEYDRTQRVSKIIQRCGGTIQIDTIPSKLVVDVDTNDEENLAPLVLAEDAVEHDITYGQDQYITRNRDSNPLTVTDALGNVTTYAYNDPATDGGRLNSISQPDPNGGTTALTTSYGYDYYTGNINSITSPFVTSQTSNYDNAEAGDFFVLSSFSDGAHTTNYSYDDTYADLITADVTNSPQHQITHYTYTSGISGVPDGLLENVIDTEGRITHYEYDRDLVTSVTTAYGTPVAATISYGYDSRDRVHTVTDANGNVTTYAWNDLNQLIERDDPDPDGSGLALAPIWKFSYDSNGNQIAVQDPNGNLTQTVYDVRDRAVQVIQPVADPAVFPSRITAEESSAGMSYDGSWTQITAAGAHGDENKLKFSTTGGANVTYEGDDLDDSKKYLVLVRWVPPTGTSGYNSANSAARWQVSTTDSWAAPLASLRVDLNKPVQGVADPGGYMWQALGAFNPVDGSLFVRLDEGDGSGALCVDAIQLVEVGPVTSYQWDCAGKMTSMTDPLGNTTLYAHDALNRLTQVIQPVADPEATVTVTTFHDDDGTFSGDATETASADAASGYIMTADDVGESVTFSHIAADSANYLVLVRWVPDGGDSNAYDSDAVVQVYGDDLSELRYSGRLNLNRAPHGFQDADGFEWKVLGAFSTSDSGHIHVALSDDNADGLITIDSVRFIYVGPVTQYAYDSVGWTTSVTDPNGDVTAYVHDWSNHQTLRVQVGDPGLRTTYTSTSSPNPVLLSRTEDNIDVGVNTNFGDTGLHENFKVVWTGAVYIDTSEGTDDLRTIFYLLSEQPAHVYIDGHFAVTSSDDEEEASSELALSQGWHYLEVDYTWSGSGYDNGILLSYALPGQEQVIVPAEALRQATLSTTHFDGAMRVDYMMNPLGATTANTLGGLDQMTAQETSGAVTGDQRSDAIYDPLGNVLASWVGSDTNTRVQYVYDDRNQLIQTIQPIADAHSPDYQVLDDDEAAAQSENWESPSGASGAYGDVSTASSTGAWVHYNFTELAAAKYEVLLRWVNDSNDTTAFDSNALVEVYGDTDVAPLATWRINLNSAVSGLNSSTVGYVWKNLGAYVPDDGSLTIKISDDDNNGILTIDALQVIEAGPVTTFSYDANGNRTSLTDPDGNTTTWQYDGLNRVTHETDPLGHSKAFAYDVMSNLVRVADRNGLVTQYTYDRLNRQTAEIWAQETSAPEVVGRYLFYNNSLFDGYDDGANSDDDDAIAPDKQALLPGENASWANESSYDQGINGIMIDIAAGSIDAENISLSDFTFRVGTDNDPSGWDDAPTPMAFAVRAGEGVDGSDRITITWDNEDIFNQWLQVTAKADNHTGLSAPDVFYFGNLVGDSDGAVGEDGFGVDINDYTNLTAEYTATGVPITDPVDFNRDGDININDYNDLSGWYNETLVAFTPPAVRTIAYSYDDDSRLRAVTERNADNDPVGADYTYTYDNLGRATQMLATVAGLSTPVTLDQTFDAFGNRIVFGASVDETLDFHNNYYYDGFGRLVQLTQGAQEGGNSMTSKLVIFSYNAAGQILGIDRYQGDSPELAASSLYGYDGIGRLTSIVHTLPGDPDPTQIFYGWQYNTASQITEFDIGPPGDLDEYVTYGYDASGQLLTANYANDSQADETYSFDDNGNRTMEDYSTTTGNVLESDGVYTYEYDLERNLVKRTAGDGSYTVYTYDHRNRLVSATDYDDEDNVVKAVTYDYDYLDRAIAKTIDPDGDGEESASTEFSIYDGNRAVLKLDSEGAISERLLWETGVDMLLADEVTADGLFWDLTDNLGTTRDIAQYDNGTTSVVNHLALNSFGKILNQTEDAPPTTLAYAGLLWDGDLQQYRSFTRIYDAGPGRWTQPDWIGFGGGLSNLGDYVGNSATNWVDPSGRAIHSGDSGDFDDPVKWPFNWDPPPPSPKPGELDPQPPSTIFGYPDPIKQLGWELRHLPRRHGTIPSNRMPLLGRRDDELPTLKSRYRGPTPQEVEGAWQNLTSPFGPGRTGTQDQLRRDCNRANGLDEPPEWDEVEAL